MQNGKNENGRRKKKDILRGEITLKIFGWFKNSLKAYKMQKMKKKKKNWGASDWIWTHNPWVYVHAQYTYILISRLKYQKKYSK